MTPQGDLDSNVTPLSTNQIDQVSTRDDQMSSEMRKSPFKPSHSLTYASENRSSGSTPSTIPTASRMDTTEMTEKHRRMTLMGLFVGFMTALGGFIYGYDTGVINSVIEMAYVKRVFSRSGEAFTAVESSVITAILSLGTFCGALSAAVLSDRLGRRITIILCTAGIFNLGIILQIISHGSPLLCVGRFVSGFGVGIISAVMPLYQAEASPKWIRGSIISMYQWAITWGLLVSSAIAQGTHKINSPACYRIPIGVQLIFGTGIAAGMAFLPESPRYYVKRGRLDEAIMSLTRLRRLSPEDPLLLSELIEIKASHDYEMSFGHTSWIDCFRNSPSRIAQRKRMFTGIFLQAFQQCSGINFIFYYGVNFFVRTGVENSYLMSLVTYICNVVFTVPGILLVETLGRRTLLLVGALGMAISNVIIGLVGIETDSIVANKVMLVFVCTFIAFFASTWGPVCWVVVGEVYGLSVRQKAVSLCSATNWLCNFIFAFCTPYLIDTEKHTAALGTKIFFMWGGFNILSFFASYWMVYETKGLMLEDIDELYRVCPVARKSGRMRRAARRRAALDRPLKISGRFAADGAEGEKFFTVSPQEPIYGLMTVRAASGATQFAGQFVGNVTLEGSAKNTVGFKGHVTRDAGRSIQVTGHIQPDEISLLTGKTTGQFTTEFSVSKSDLSAVAVPETIRMPYDQLTGSFTAESSDPIPGTSVTGDKFSGSFALRHRRPTSSIEESSSAGGSLAKNSAVSAVASRDISNSIPLMPLTQVQSPPALMSEIVNIPRSIPPSLASMSGSDSDTEAGSPADQSLDFFAYGDPSTTQSEDSTTNQLREILQHVEGVERNQPNSHTQPHN